jgi:hypothetical protein
MKQKIINSIYNNCNVRLKPSRVCSGVGVFSIIPIKKNTILFEDVMSDDIHIKWEEINSIDQRIIDYLSTMCNLNNEGIFLTRTVNNINLSYFVNHSKEPNVIHDLEKDVFITIRDIEIDEEILCVYTEEEMIGFKN